MWAQATKRGNNTDVNENGRKLGALRRKSASSCHMLTLEKMKYKSLFYYSRREVEGALACIKRSQSNVSIDEQRLYSTYLALKHDVTKQRHIENVACILYITHAINFGCSSRDV